MGDVDSSSTKALERRTEILDGAAELFRRFGYPEVGIDDIGRAAGVSGPAIYRHFDGKQELLDLVIKRYLGALMHQWQGFADEGAEGAILAGVVNSAIDHPDEYYVYSTQRHWLEGQRAVELKRQRQPIQDGWAELLGRYGIVHGKSEARFRLVAMEGVLIHASLTAKASRTARTSMALETSKAILSVPLPEAVVPTQGFGGGVLRHHNRREEVFAAAIGLFADRGFASVTLKDIGAEVGVSASAIHRHFDSKDSILATALERNADQMRAAINVAIARASTAREAVDDIARRVSTLFAENRELFGLNLYLATSLPREAAISVRQNRRINLDEMAHLVKDATPGLTLATARVRVGAMLSALNDVVRNPRLAGIANSADMLTIVSKLILLQGE